ncbi:DUF3408 domain-containing protein [Chryseobacterium sp. RG1]|uniref:DUF3408 domain-containing protein n=1 Tax=Chryseobacterium tagetis TaxID=2801334 RepID=A0ABS8A1E8_9FLAO|nr:DUF3408 domain-containing protein [Chryseobacterium tagetis]MCA6067783.1 DUF3408 domain-containing protein [Chryseobacterium tagetis]
MNNENLQHQKEEELANLKKETSNEVDSQSEEKVDNNKFLTDEYLKYAMTEDMTKEIDPIRSQSLVSGNTRSKRSGLTEKEYFEIFFLIPEQNANKGRTIYICSEFYQKFLKLIAGLEIDRLTMYAYLDNIIECHFTHFEELIHKIYHDRNKPLF